MKIKLSFFMTMMFFTVSTLFSAQFYSGGQVTDTAGDDEFDIGVYNSPGWVTNNIKEGGAWSGNDDLDGLTRNLRIVGQVVYPEGAGFELSGKDLRNFARKVFDRDLFAGTFNTEVKYSEDFLPYLHISAAVLPSGVIYAVKASVRLMENLKLTRDSWAKDFQWQGATWEREKLLFSRRGQVNSDIEVAIKDMIEDFIKQYLSDMATRKEIDDEYEEIEKEVEEEYSAIKKELKNRSQELEGIYEGEYETFREQLFSEDFEEKVVPEKVRKLEGK